MTLAKIIYASMTGNTEEITYIIEEALTELGVEVEREESTFVEAADFKNADICIVATYTYSSIGEGELPDEIVDLYEELPETDLSGKVFGVAGSGDTFYEDFCKSVDDFEIAFEKTGAKKGADNVKVDLACDEEDIEKLKKFAKDLVAAVES